MLTSGQNEHFGFGASGSQARAPGLHDFYVCTWSEVGIQLGLYQAGSLQSGKVPMASLKTILKGMTDERNSGEGSRRVACGRPCGASDQGSARKRSSDRFR